MEEERILVEIKCGGKTKTFTNDREANRFLGTHIPEMNYSQLRPELYYAFNRHEFWDDGMEMTGAEWANVATTLLLNF